MPVKHIIYRGPLDAVPQEQMAAYMGWAYEYLKNRYLDAEVECYNSCGTHFVQRKGTTKIVQYRALDLLDKLPELWRKEQCN